MSDQAFPLTPDGVGTMDKDGGHMQEKEKREYIC